ncbi:nitrite reductase small subunit NirD [Roseibium sp.]|uniref:nitrite reductase small subunit NirD n=1 Tax=Roseibium sp. TaxID=1936156 RepID=UPI0035126950
MSDEPTGVDIGGIDDIPTRGSRIIETPSTRIAIFRTVDDAIFAIEDRCPHLKGPLSQGIVHAHNVTCPLHNLVIDLETGRAQAPEGGCVTTYPVEIRDGRIFLQLRSVNPAKVA